MVTRLPTIERKHLLLKDEIEKMSFEIMYQKIQNEKITETCRNKLEQSKQSLYLMKTEPLFYRSKEKALSKNSKPKRV